MTEEDIAKRARVLLRGSQYADTAEPLSHWDDLTEPQREGYSAFAAAVMIVASLERYEKTYR